MGERVNIDFPQREENRSLSPAQVIERLRTIPDTNGRIKIVGGWVWVTFDTRPSKSVRSQLSQLGFHWSNPSRCWQHPTLV
jgi:hypothetical protein